MMARKPNPKPGPKPEPSPEQRELDKARKRVTRLLAATDRSRAELEEKLVRAGFSAGTVKQVLAEFTKARLLDDQKLAARLVEREMARAPADAPLLRAKLERKGLDEGTTDRTVDQALAGRDLLEDAKQAVETKLRSTPDARRLGHTRLVGRLLGFLARRGFEQETAETAVESVLRARKLWNPPGESAD